MLFLLLCSFSERYKIIRHEEQINQLSAGSLKTNRKSQETSEKNECNNFENPAFTNYKSLNTIINNAVKDCREKNISVNGSNDYILKSELQKLDYEAISGFSTVQLIPEITVKFQLVDKDGKVVWTDLITGKANTKGAKFEKFLPPAIDNLIQQLVNNQDFLNNVITE